jgi:hypothetical protein
MILLFADMDRLTHRRRSDIIFLMFYGSEGREAHPVPAPPARPPPRWFALVDERGTTSWDEGKCYSILWVDSEKGLERKSIDTPCFSRLWGAPEAGRWRTRGTAPWCW